MASSGRDNTFQYRSYVETPESKDALLQRGIVSREENVITGHPAAYLVLIDKTNEARKPGYDGCAVALIGQIKEEVETSGNKLYTLQRASNLLDARQALSSKFPLAHITTSTGAVPVQTFRSITNPGEWERLPIEFWSPSPVTAPH